MVRIDIFDDPLRVASLLQCTLRPGHKKAKDFEEAFEMAIFKM